MIDELLNNEQYEILVFEFSGVTIRNPKIIGKVKIYYGDFTNKNDLEKVFSENLDIFLVIHSLSTTDPAKSNDNMEYDIKSNLISSINLLELMKKYLIPKIYFFSSGGTVYGRNLPKKVKEENEKNPICSYGIIKLTIEKYITLFHQLYGLEYIIFRLSNPYGMYHNSDRQGLINVILKKILKKEIVEIWGDGEIVRDYIYIQDLVKIVSSFIESDIKNEIFNLGSGDGYSINQIIDIITNIVGPFELKYSMKRNFDIKNIVLNNEKIKTYYHYKLTPIHEGIMETYKWLKKMETR